MMITTDFDLYEKLIMHVRIPPVALRLLFAFFINVDFFHSFSYELWLFFEYSRKKERTLSASVTNSRRLPIRIFMCR